MSHPARPRSHRPPFRSLIVLLVVAMLAAMAGETPAAAKDGPRAITAMDSGVSSLRTDPQGRPVTQAERDGQLATDTNLPRVGNSDGMGTPADKTVLESDAVYRQTNVTSSSGNTATATAYTLNEDMSGVSGTPAESPLSQRSLIDQQFPSVGGHFLDATHMGVLDFKAQAAGTDAVLSLTSPNQAVEGDWTLGTTVTLPDPGTTFAFVQGSGASRTALTNSGIAGSKALGTQARSETLVAGTPAASQLWAVLDAGYDDGSFLLVNRADGLCLAWSGQYVSIDTCIDDPSRHWKYNNDPSNNVWIFPSQGDSQSSLGSDGGQGVPSTLGANTVQTWSALPLQETGGSITSWSMVRTGDANKGNVVPYDLAVGDLDGVVNQDDQAKGLAFHDEAALVYGDENDDLQIRVVDFHANGNRQLVTAPSQTLSLEGGLGSADITMLGDIVAGIGDFNADGRNELAVGYQDSSQTFTFSFYTYSRTDSGGRILKPYDCASCNNVQPFAATKNTSGETGYADLAVGDVDGDGADDLALGFATWASATNWTDHYAHLGIWTLNRYDSKNTGPDLTTRSVEVVDMPTDQGTLPRPLNADPTRTQSGIRLAEGNLFYASENNFGPQRSEIAIAYSQYNVSPGFLDTEADIYKVEPVFAIFSSMLTDCNATLTTCDTTTTQTNTQKTPSPLFPSNSTQWTYRPKGTHFDPAPISIVAGGFGGQDTDDPPVDGLLAGMATEGTQLHDSAGSVTWYTQDAIVVPWSDKTKDSTSWAVSDTITKTSSINNGPVTLSPWHQHHYTAYDRLGLSLVLGAPGIMSIEQAFKPTVIAAEPPTQVDWLNGGWSNISASSSAYLQTASTSAKAFASGSENENSVNMNVTEGADAKVSWGAYTYFGPDESGSVELQEKYTHAWSALNQSSTNTSSSFGNTSSAQTNQDDDISYSLDDSVLYRYPVLGNAGYMTGDDSCQSGCRAYYDVIIPKGSAFHKNMSGQDIDGGFFQPSWSNMNALSYQPINSNAQNPVPLPDDLGSYFYADQSGAHTVTAPLYNASTVVSANNNVIALDFSKSAGASATRTTTRTDETNEDVSASGTISFGDPVKEGGNYVDLTFGASFGYAYSKTMSSSTTGSNTTTTDQAFELHYPVFDAGKSYGVGTIFYYAKDGSAKVVHGVDLTASTQGRGWWTQNYGKTPDPALNLPGRIGLGYDKDDLVYDTPYWFTSPQRQLIRQFATLQTDDANDPNGVPTAGDPLVGNAIAGQRLTFQVPVHNYSLADMASGTTAAWYAVPVDPHDNDVLDLPISLGTSQVPAIKAQGVANVQAPIWTAQASSTNTVQTYRIFVQLDPDNTAPDMHPLSGDGCPTDSLEPTGITGVDPVLYDTMRKGKADPLGCGQNNQGYGLVTVSPEGGVGAERHARAGDPANAKLAGGGLVDGNPDHLVLTEKSDVPTVLAGQRVTGIVRATSSLQLNDHPVVVVFDGPVADGKVVSVTKLRGIDDEAGGAATFDWTPDKPGVHELHTVLLSTKAAGQDDEQIMRVNVEALDPYTVTASASPSAVPVDGAFSITGSATPVGPTALSRTVKLQEKVGSEWTEIDSQQTSSKGHFGFDLVGTKAGTHTYRVWKIATSGRAAGISAPVTVRVGGRGGAFVVTAKATPTTVDLGKSVTFTGTALPAQAAAKDRFVDLQVKSGSTWKTVASGQTTASGTFRLTTKPAKEGTHSYRVTKRATAGLPAASSPPVPVRVVAQFAVTATVSPPAITLGQRATISGKVTPPPARPGDRRVELQVRSGSSWRRVATGETRASGGYAFSVKPMSTGVHTYRVVKPATPGKRAAVSPPVTVKVKRR